jgi:hypothetical protein
MLKAELLDASPPLASSMGRSTAKASCDGNGMFKSLGNIVVNPSVGMLFIAMHGKPQRLRVNGEATVSDQDPLLVRTAR